MHELQPGKGRLERANRKLKDRLAKELRLAEVTGIEAGNAFLPTFVGGSTIASLSVLQRPRTFIAR